jgi:hypothetical protein
MVQDTMMLSYLDQVTVGRFPSVNLRFKDKDIEDWCKANFDIWDLRAEYLTLKPYELNRYINVALLYCPNEQIKMLFKLFWMDGKTDFAFTEILTFWVDNII